jgi:hypothetical protein
MCRWLAYTGSPILLPDVLYTPAHSLIDQSRSSHISVRRSGRPFSRRTAMPGAWHEMPEASCGVAGKEDDQLRSFAGQPPSKVL